VRKTGLAGRRFTSSARVQAALAQQLYDTGERTVRQIADLFQVPGTTIYGYLEPGSATKRLAASDAD
jgi:hypothetical protein